MLLQNGSHRSVYATFWLHASLPQAKTLSVPPTPAHQNPFSLDIALRARSLRASMNAKPSNTPVLIIQGFLAPTATNIVLKSRLLHEGFVADDVPLEGLNAGDIRESARAVEMSVNAMRARTDSKQVDLIGVSMGGLIGLQYLRKLGGDEFVRRFVAIGTPFYGTELARVIQMATFGAAPGARQMIPGSEFLKELHATQKGDKTKIFSLHTSADAFVSENAAKLEGATLVKSPHGLWPTGHYTPLFLKKDFSIIRDILQSE